MARTLTGGFPIGFRRGWSPWQRDLDGLTRFAKESGFEFIDIGPEPVVVAQQVTGTGLRLGTVDVVTPWDGLCSPDAGKRHAAVDRAAEHIKACGRAGVKTFFVVVVPEDQAKSRAENLELAADGYGRLCQAIASTGAKIAIEGWPGRAPHFASLACTPDGYRAFFKAVGSEILGINFDPSHLVRMGIDPLRFLGEFGNRVWHVHAKDTQFLEEELYQYGNLQGAIAAKPHGFGGHHWRYALPGHGAAPWHAMLHTLKNCGYGGDVSIELEDENFNGTEEGEKRGLIESRDFLAGV